MVFLNIVTQNRIGSFIKWAHVQMIFGSTIGQLHILMVWGYDQQQSFPLMKAENEHEPFCKASDSILIHPLRCVCLSLNVFQGERPTKNSGMFV